MPSIYRRHDRQEHVDDPQWEGKSRIHDWRNHVGDRAKAAWMTFTPEQRMLLAADAEDEASAEQWPW